MTQPTVLIKKYSDRRLYDPGASRYVKLDDIARMVREGTDVKVVDARSGRDLTSTILTQIIVEDSRDRDTALPLQLLQQLVRASDRATHDFVSSYLNTAFELYQKAQEGVQSRLSEAKAAVSSPLEFVRSLVAGQPFPPPARAADDAEGTEVAEVERLRRRVEELETRLAEVSKPRRTARPRRPSKRP